MIVLPSSAGIYRPFVSSGPTPPISANLARWYSANYGITSSGGVVSQMDDLSGNGQHATQSTSGKRPSLITNARKTNSMLSFDGVDDAVTFNGITLTGDFSIYWVGSIEETPGNSSGYFTQNDNGGASSTNGVNNFAAGVYWYNNGGDILANNLGRVYQTSLDIVCIRRTGSTITCEINDLDDSTSPANANPTIGCIGHAFTGYSQMKFGEMLVYTAYHGTSDKTTVVNALKSTWKYPTLPVSGAALWLDGSRWDTLYTTDTGSTNVATNGGAIGRWEDLSGNARHGKARGVNNTTYNSAQRPTWNSPNNGINGLGTLSFNGTNQWLAADSTEAWNMVFSGDYTIDLWAKFPNNTAQQDLFGQDTGGGQQPKWILGLNNPGVAGSGVLGFLYNISTVGNYVFGVNWTPTNNVAYRITVTRFGNDTKFFINGLQQGATQTSANRPRLTTGIKLAIGQDGENYKFTNGQIGEAVFYPFAYGVSDFSAMATYSSQKWGV